MAKNSNTTANTKEPDFEESLAELEKIVTTLEGEVKLNEAIILFERGTKLSQKCQKFLNDAEQKVEVLRRSTEGDIVRESFSDEEADEIVD